MLSHCDFCFVIFFSWSILDISCNNISQETVKNCTPLKRKSHYQRDCIQYICGSVCTCLRRTLSYSKDMVDFSSVSFFSPALKGETIWIMIMLPFLMTCSLWPSLCTPRLQRLWLSQAYLHWEKADFMCTPRLELCGIIAIFL